MSTAAEALHDCMVSSCGARRGFVLVIWGMGPLLWFSGTFFFFSKKSSTCRAQGMGLRVSNLLLIPCCSLKSVYAEGWGRKRYQPSPTSPERGVCACHCPRSPSRRANNLPSCFPGIPQFPVFTLSVPSACLAAWCTCVLSKAGQLSLKKPNC